mmetsp:Transcript_11504/g.36563  ORF Transcript_11504/g.36563 Transcript_11504/m.36563 type:complete len:268 (-) Transcript_11504:2977-3780(-)
MTRSCSRQLPRCPSPFPLHPKRQPLLSCMTPLHSTRATWPTSAAPPGRASSTVPSPLTHPRRRRSRQRSPQPSSNLPTTPTPSPAPTPALTAHRTAASPESPDTLATCRCGTCIERRCRCSPCCTHRCTTTWCTRCSPTLPSRRPRSPCPSGCWARATQVPWSASMRWSSSPTRSPRGTSRPTRPSLTSWFAPPTRSTRRTCATATLTRTPCRALLRARWPPRTSTAASPPSLASWATPALPTTLAVVPSTTATCGTAIACLPVPAR